MPLKLLSTKIWLPFMKIFIEQTSAKVLPGVMKRRVLISWLYFRYSPEINYISQKTQMDAHANQWDKTVSVSPIFCMAEQDFNKNRICSCNQFNFSLCFGLVLIGDRLKPGFPWNYLTFNLYGNPHSIFTTRNLCIELTHTKLITEVHYFWKHCLA